MYPSVVVVCYRSEWRHLVGLELPMLSDRGLVTRPSHVTFGARLEHMGVVRTKSGLTSTTRTTRDQLIIFIDIITKIHFLEGRRMPFRPVSSNQSRHVLRAHRRFTALVYATFRSPTTPHRSRVTRHLPGDIGHGNGWILLSDSDQSEESNGWILLSDSDQSERSSHAR